MLKFFSPFLMALLVVGGNAQDDTLLSSAKLIRGKSYHFDSENFPYQYTPGYKSRWVLNSDGPIQFICSTMLEKTPNCTESLLSIHDGINRIMMCDTGIHKYTSLSNDVKVTFYSLPGSKPGSFICSFVVPELGPTEIEVPSTLPPPPPPAPTTPPCICGAKNFASGAKEPETGVNEFPMMAGLVDLRKKVVICGATIINDKQVLTAAQCVLGNDAKNIGVLVGDHDLSTFNETRATKFYLVDWFKVHENYNDNNQNNIAIVTIKMKISFGPQVSPVCLPFLHHLDTFAGDFVNIVGWESSASDNKNIVPTILKKAKLSVMPNWECSETNEGLTYTNLCTRTKCEGIFQLTKGGPILWENPSTGRLVGVGIIGEEFGCMEENPFQINTRVGAFINWIEQNTPEGVRYCNPE